MRDDADFTPWGNRGLSGPPRSVPLSVRLRILFGGFGNQFGWFFFGFGMIFVWVFGGTATLHDLVFFSGDLAVADARITDVVETNVTIDERRVYEYQYAYRVDDIALDGATQAMEGKYHVGDRVVVEYPVRSHERSRIRGLSISDDWVALVCTIFPLIGLIFIFFGVRKGFKGARLLRHGKQATGVLISTEPTNCKVNEQMVYKFTFRFKADDARTYEVVARTHVTERFARMDSYREPLLYNPWKPSDAILLDDLPGGPRINENGEIHGTSLSMLRLLIIPGVSCIGHGLWFLHVLEVV
jgi:hypothetical protein